MIRIRDVASADLARIRELNELALPAVNSIEVEDFAWFAEHASSFRVAEDTATNPGGIAGFLVALTPGSDYASDNYLWFSAQYDAFMYVDRIVVSDQYRGQGVGRALYDDLTERSRGQQPCITCEVNTRPPNPASMAFHTRLGFVQVGEQDSENGNKSVALLRMELS